jgi:hypothetical protein
MTGKEEGTGVYPLEDEDEPRGLDYLRRLHLHRGVDDGGRLRRPPLVR